MPIKHQIFDIPASFVMQHFKNCLICFKAEKLLISKTLRFQKSSVFPYFNLHIIEREVHNTVLLFACLPKYLLIQLDMIFLFVSKLFILYA